jgi:hypothetical protein
MNEHEREVEHPDLDADRRRRELQRSKRRGNGPREIPNGRVTSRDRRGRARSIFSGAETESKNNHMHGHGY